MEGHVKGENLWKEGKEETMSRIDGGKKEKMNGKINERQEKKR